MVCKVDGNLQFDPRDWSMSSRLLKARKLRGYNLQTVRCFPLGIDNTD